jgi:nitrite reductase/ring-hydroxylating ferredoxin subunit
MVQEHTPIEADPKRGSRKQWFAGKANDVPERGRLVIEAGGRTIGIYRLDGKLYAYENICPHQGGPVCQGFGDSLAFISKHWIFDVIEDLAP